MIFLVLYIFKIISKQPLAFLGKKSPTIFHGVIVHKSRYCECSISKNFVQPYTVSNAKEIAIIEENKSKYDQIICDLMDYKKF